MPPRLLCERYFILLRENLKFEKQITLPIPSRSNIFGVPLEDLMGFDGEKGSVPRVIKDCTQFLRETGLEEEGLFRRSPASVMLTQAQEAYDRGSFPTPFIIILTYRSQGKSYRWRILAIHISRLY